VRRIDVGFEHTRIEPSERHDVLGEIGDGQGHAALHLATARRIQTEITEFAGKQVVALCRAARSSSSGSLAMFAAIRRASSLLSNLAAERRPHGAGLWP
jgi:hypothetical protein